MYALTKTDNKPGSLALLKRPVPRPGPGQVLLRVQAVSVCGSDLHIRVTAATPAPRLWCWATSCQAPSRSWARA